MFLHFWFFTCCAHPFSYRTSFFTKGSYALLCSYFHYAHLEISSRDEVFTCFFLFFFITGWIFISVFLTGMSSSRNEISSRQKYVNRKKHFTIDRDDFILGRISSQEEVSRIKTIWMMILQRSISIVHKYYGNPILQDIYKFI